MATKKGAPAPLSRSKRKPPGRTAGKVQPSIDRREAFVIAYMGEAKMNGTLAATIAGYSPDSAHVMASQLLDEPDVIAKIDAIKAKRRAEQETRATEIIDMLFETAMGRTLATVGVSEGAPVLGEPNHAARIKAGEMCLKMSGSYTEKVEIFATSDRLQVLADTAREKERLAAEKASREAQLRERGDRE